MIISSRAALIISFCGLSTAFSSLSAAPVELGVASAAPAYAPGEILVKFRAGTGAQLRASTVSGLGDRETRTLGASGYTLIKLQGGRTLDTALSAYAALGNVEAVQPNYLYKYSVAPNDPLYGELWALKNIGQTVTGETYGSPKVPGSDMRLEDAWDRRTDCSTTVVAVLDSGVNYTHQDLAPNMWNGSAAGFPHHGFDFVDDDDDPMPSDGSGHGTHVAATIGAAGNNGTGMTGVCWKASLMALRVGGAGGATTAGLIQGIDFAAAHGAKVMNISLGGSNPDPALQASTESARAKGLIVVAAAGNEGADNDNTQTPSYPCNFAQDNIICVAALDQGYGLASFSNFGAATVDVGAPGTNIASAWPGATIADDMTGWSRSAGWHEITCAFTGGTFRMLVDPAQWCSPASQYAPNANDVAYKSFNLGGASHAQAEFLAFINLEPGHDFLGVAKSASGGEPFTANPASILETSSATGATPARVALSLNDCVTTNCTFGFRLRSDGSVNGQGVGILNLQINTTQPNSNVYRVNSGTSMAAPHVAGVVALVWAQKPGATYVEVLNAVKLGGDPVPALAGKTVTGRAVNAAGALRLIDPPQ